MVKANEAYVRNGNSLPFSKYTDSQKQVQCLLESADANQDLPRYWQHHDPYCIDLVRRLVDWTLWSALKRLGLIERLMMVCETAPTNHLLKQRMSDEALFCSL